MKLLYIHNNYIDSQQANVVQVANMCQAFAQNGIEVCLGIAKPKSHGVIPERVMEQILGEKALFQITAYPKFSVGGRLEILGGYFGVQALIKNTTADLCFVRDPLALRLCTDSKHATIFESHHFNLHNRSKWLNTFWTQDLIKNAKSTRVLKFITISAALAELWEKRGIPAPKILPLHDGFSHQAFSELPETQTVRQILKIPRHAKVAVYTGSLQPDRGIERIIELAKMFPEVLFIVVGGPETRARHFADICHNESVGNIQWIGHVPHSKVPLYLSAADVLLMLWTWDTPTINICSPLKLFEYMAAGKIIVGEAYPTIGEVVTEKTAYLSLPGSFDNLCKNFSLAINANYPSPMAEKAQELAMKEYTWDKRAQKIIESIQGSL